MIRRRPLNIDCRRGTALLSGAKVYLYNRTLSDDETDILYFATCIMTNSKRLRDFMQSVL